MDLKDNGKDISSTACKTDDPRSSDEKNNPVFAEKFAKAVSEWLNSLIDDAGITDEEWKEAFEGYDPEISEMFADDISVILNSLIDGANVSENDHTPIQRLRDHFEDHCLAKSRSKVSVRERIYYDFKDNSQYAEYDRQISKQTEESDNKVDSLFDYEGILPALEKLFEGDSAVMFCNSCDLQRNGHMVSLSLVSFADSVTRNYKGGRTITVCIKNAKGKTIVLYPVDALLLKEEFGLLIEKYKK